MHKNSIKIVLKGMIVGGTMLVPGVSGGSIAMILGLYDRLISSVSSFSKRRGENFSFLALFSLGSGLGMLLFASPLLQLIERYPLPMLHFFLGAVAGGIPPIFRQAGLQAFSWKAGLYIGVGLLTVLLFTSLPSEVLQAKAQPDSDRYLLLAFAGFVAAVALVLPGISISYLLLLLGIYNETVRAIGTLHLPFLLPLGTGLLLGIILTTRLLERAMAKHPQPTYLTILGFVLGSMAEVFPGFPAGLDILLCIVALALGFGAIRCLSSF